MTLVGHYHKIFTFQSFVNQNTISVFFRCHFRDWFIRYCQPPDSARWLARNKEQKIIVRQGYFTTY